MVPFQKRVKIPHQKWYHFRKVSKCIDKDDTISKKGQNSSTKMVPFQKRVKIPHQKWYHFRKWLKFLKKMVPFQAEKGHNSSKKWYHFRKLPKFLNKNGTILEKSQKSSTKMVSFQKRVKIPKQKWYHFRKWLKFLNKNGTISGRKGSKFLNKNGTISENCQNSSTKMVPFQKSQKSSTKVVPFQKRVKILHINGTISVRKGS